MPKYKTLPTKSTSKIFIGLFITVLLVGCGGSETQKVTEKINGPGGIYVGAFVEQDTDEGDFDIGGIYFDIPNDVVKTVTGALSYQNWACQDPNTLTFKGTKARYDLAIQPTTGRIDPRVSANSVTDDASRLVGLTFKVNFDDKVASPKPWSGSFNVQNTSQPKKRISQTCAGQLWTQAPKAQFDTYRTTEQFGISIAFDAANRVASWQAPDKTTKTLIMELDNALISTTQNAFIKQTVSTSALSSYQPSEAKNITLVVIAFDDNNQQLGFDTITIN